jgi:hypothetical protein
LVEARSLGRTRNWLSPEENQTNDRDATALASRPDHALQPAALQKVPSQKREVTAG